MSTDMWERHIGEACVCVDLGLVFAEDCKAHVVHREIETAPMPDPAKMQATLTSLASGHFRHDPPGPVPGPIPGVCFSCGNTGERYHGPGIDGPVWGGECGCDLPFCGGCGERWPCDDIKTIAEAFSVEIDEDDE